MLLDCWEDNNQEEPENTKSETKDTFLLLSEQHTIINKNSFNSLTLIPAKAFKQAFLRSGPLG